MKSICIKTNNSKSINYLLNLLKNSHLKEICYSTNSFRHYQNIIIHCNNDFFYNLLTEISKYLSFLVIDYFEESLLKRLIYTNYFYFDFQERSTVLDISVNLLSELDNNSNNDDSRQTILYNLFYKYLLENRKIVLDGFINFRLKKYLDYLNSVIDDAVNHFIVEREYLEFISLLKVYISQEPSTKKSVHLIYINSNSILLDDEKRILKNDENIFKTKYLSDISFSANDYTLNTLLNLVPEKIYLHLLDGFSDEFINTLHLIFENRIKICYGCSFCKDFKNSFSKSLSP